MKKIILFILGFMLLIMKVNAVNLEDHLILGTYNIKYELNGEIGYEYIYAINDTDGFSYYKLFPGDGIKGTTVEKEYNKIRDYKYLTREQINKIKLAINYGYNARGKTPWYWYGLTQLVIYRIVLNDDSISLVNASTKELNTSYDRDIQTILDEIENHSNEVNDLVLDVDYNGKINKSNVSGKRMVNCPYINCSYNNETLIIDNVLNDGSFSIVIDDYQTDVGPSIYEMSNGQHIYKCGYLEQDVFVKVANGFINFNLNIKEDIFEDNDKILFSLMKDDQEIKTLNFSNNKLFIQEMVPIGNYSIKLKNGSKYTSEEMNIVVGGLNHFVVDVDLSVNLLLKTLNINKKICSNDNCVGVKNNIFNIYDSLDNLVTSINTDDMGFASVILGYGTYKLLDLEDNEERIIEVLDDKPLNEDFISYIEIPDTGLVVNYYLLIVLVILLFIAVVCIILFIKSV